MQAELPLLLYPISDIDPDDPLDIITFEGVLAVPVDREGPKYERAITNIAFFQLNHQDLTSRRAQELLKLWIAMDAHARAPHSAGSIPALVIERMCSEESHLSACMAAFKALYLRDPALAREYAQLASTM